MKKQISLLLIFLLLSSIPLFAQSPLDRKLSSTYTGKFDYVMTKIAKQTGIKFKYDLEKVKEIDVDVQHKNKTLSEVLTTICKDNKLKFYLNQDSVVCIVDRAAKSAIAMQLSVKSFKGNPTKSDFVVTGRVVDQKSHETLPYVNITVLGTKIGTSTNIDGYFTLPHVPSDTSTLVVNYIGYKREFIYLVPSVSVEGLDIEIEEEILNIQEVTITADKQDILQANAQVSMLKLTPLKLFTLPNLGEKDIFRSFQLMPGISAANENSSGLYVRGGTPDQVLVLYDGFTVYNVEHLFGFFSAFNSNAIKDVQLFKGGFEPKYGGRLSSVVEITGKEGDKKLFNACADISLMSVNAFVEFPIKKKFTAIFSVRRSWKSTLYEKIFQQFTKKETSDKESRPKMPGFNDETEVKSYFYDMNAKLTYRPTDKDILTFSLYNGADHLDNSISPNMPSRPGGGGGMSMTNTDLTKWGNTGASIKWSRHYSERFYSNLLFSYSNYFSKRDRTNSRTYTNSDDETVTEKNGILQDNRLDDLSTKIDCEYKLTKNHQIGYGLFSTYNKISFNDSQSDTLTQVNLSGKGATMGTYIQDNAFFFNNKLNVIAGFRHTYYTRTNKNYIEPRVNMNYQLTKRFKLKASVGKYYQFAKRVVREDIMLGSRDFWVLTDNNLLPVSSAWHYIAGFALDTKDFLFDVEAYYKKLYNLNEYSLRINPGRNANYSENFFAGTGISKGIDFLAQKKYGNYTGWVAYTLGQATNRYEVYGDYDFFASNDVTHEFKIVQSYKWHNWTFSADWIYTTGRPYTIPEGNYSLTLLDGTTQDFINASVKNGVRLPDYHRLDVSATYNFTVFEGSPCSISFSLFNAYNQKNIWYKEYTKVDNELIETPVYYLGITPNINLTIKFR